MSSSKHPAHPPDIPVLGKEPDPGGAASVAGGAPGGPVAEPPSRDELERVRERDPQALSAFFERYFERVYGLVARLVGERSTAEDITQEVFLKVYRSIHHLDPSRDPAPWLTTIAYNACRDLWRSGAHRMSRRSGSIEADPGFSERLSAGTNDPERDLIAGESARRVREAIDRLPEPLRVSVLLHDYQGLSHSDVADLTGVNHAAARKRYSRALTALGKLLEERER